MSRVHGDPAQAVLAAIEAARAAGATLGLKATVAICDGGGHLLGLYRDPQALLASLESAQSKARTALYFGVESRLLPSQAPITPALLAAASLPLAFLPGGIPLRDHTGALWGAVGVGGGTPEQDQDLAHQSALAWRQAMDVVASA